MVAKKRSVKYKKNKDAFCLAGMSLLGLDGSAAVAQNKLNPGLLKRN